MCSRFPAQRAPSQQAHRQVNVPQQNQSPVGRGVNPHPGRGRGNVGGPPGPGRGLTAGPRGDAPLGPGPGRGRGAVLQQGREGGVPTPAGQGVQRTLRQVNTSTNIQQPALSSPQKPVTRQVLARGMSSKVASNGRGAKAVVTTVGRGRGLVSATRGGVATRLGPPPGTVKGRG